MNYATVFVKPLITEKSVAEAANFGRYTFLVNPLATKEDIKLAAKKVLGVNVISVQITRYRDHKRRINYVNPRKGSVKRKTIHLKKAVLTLSTDEKLDYYDIEA